MSDAKDESPENDSAEAGADAGAAEGGDKKKIPKLFLIIGAGLVLLIGGGAGLYFTGMLDSLLGKETADEHAEAGAEAGKEHASDKGHDKPKEKAKAKDGHGDKKGGDGHGKSEESSNFVVVPPMVVNLNTDDGTARFLRLSVQLELEDPGDHAAVTAVIPRVVDQFQTYLRELRVKDLRGSSGMYRLQMELLWRVNQAADPVKVKDVLFQEILIQ